MPNIITKRLIFFGSSEHGATVLQALYDDPHYEIVAVITKAAKPHSHQHQHETAVSRLAKHLGILILRPEKVSSIIPTFQKLQPNAGVLFAYGQMLPPDLLNVFPLGIVNLHPSLLPAFRGPSPIEAAILSGDTKTGTTIMLITPEMDAGPILSQKSISIPAGITKTELTNQLVQLGIRLLLTSLPKYLAGQLTPQPQDESRASYCRLLNKADGLLDPTQLTATQIERRIRAYAGWPKARIPVYSRGQSAILILHASLMYPESAQPGLHTIAGRLILGTKDGALEITSAQLPGKGPVRGQDLCNAGSLDL